jgi:hypothetical protein
MTLIPEGSYLAEFIGLNGNESEVSFTIVAADDSETETPNLQN